MPHDDPTRPRLLRATRRSILGTAGAGGLAGCSDRGSTGDRSPRPSPSPSPTRTPIRADLADPEDVDQVTAVYDTAGRQHGELTGSNDAQVVVDAIADRAGQAGVVVPDPGYPLEWEQEVRLPVDERGFTFLGEGMPELHVPEGFSGEYAIHKPATTGPGHDNQGYRMGGFVVMDRSLDSDGGINRGSTERLDAGILIDDLHESVVYPSVFYGCPGVVVRGSNSWSNQNEIRKPTVHSPRGPAVTLENTTGGERADQNWVTAPFYNDDTNHGDSGEIAYLDGGNDNTWLWTRVEFASVAHKFDGCNCYYVSEADWDRSHEMDAPVVERNGANGIVHAVKNHSSFQRMRLSGLHTQIAGSTDQPTALTGGPNQPPVSWEVVDLLEGAQRAVPANDLVSIGLTDESVDGGEVRLEGGGLNMTPITLATGTTAGSVARTTLGERAIQAKMAPKLGVSFTPRFGVDSGNADDVVARLGFYADGDNRVELVYDPGNDLGEHPSANWFWEVVLGGSLQTRIDTGIPPHADQEFAINREGRGGAGVWTAFVDSWSGHESSAVENEQTMFGPTPAGGNTLPPCTLRFQIRALEDARSEWWIKVDHGIRLFVM